MDFLKRTKLLMAGLLAFGIVFGTSFAGGYAAAAAGGAVLREQVRILPADIWMKKTRIMSRMKRRFMRNTQPAALKEKTGLIIIRING